MVILSIFVPSGAVSSFSCSYRQIPGLHVSQCKKAYEAYYQQQLWIQADASLEMNTESYGFTFVKNKTENVIVPGIVIPSLKTFLILVHVVNVPTRMDISLQGSWNIVLQILQV